MIERVKGRALMHFNRICNAIGSYNVTLSLRRKVLRKPRNKLLRPLAAIKTNVYKRITNEPYYGKDKDVRNSFFLFSMITFLCLGKLLSL